MTSFIDNLRDEWFSNVRGDILSGLVVALVSLFMIAATLVCLISAE